jgi:hypothetical protein
LRRISAVKKLIMVTIPYGLPGFPVPGIIQRQDVWEVGIS